MHNIYTYLQSKGAIGPFNRPYGITFNSAGEMIVSEWGNDTVCVLDHNHKKIHTVRSELMKYPSGVAVDDEDNIFVASKYCLQKFTSSGDLINEKKTVKNNSFRGLVIHNNHVYVSDRDMHCIQVFDLELKFVRSIGSLGKGKGEFNKPFDVKFDSAGNMYVAEFRNQRVQIMDKSGNFNIDREGFGLPTGLLVFNDKVYISEYENDSLVMYKTSDQQSPMQTKATDGRGIGELRCPFCIASHDNKLYVCDFGNNRVQIFNLDS